MLPPENKWVCINSSLEKEPTDYAKDQKEFSEMQETLRKIRGLL